MHDVIDRDEGLAVRVTTEAPTSGQGRYVQLLITNPDGSVYKQQFALHEEETKWISIPMKLVGGQVRVV